MIGFFSYTGYYKNFQRYGIGRENTPDGGSYFGEWKDDKINGMGILTYADGARLKGLFADGKLI